MSPPPASEPESGPGAEEEKATPSTPADIAELRTQILAFIRSWCEPANFTKRWSDVLGTNPLERLTVHPGELYPALQLEFGNDSLLASGLIEPLGPLANCEEGEDESEYKAIRPLYEEETLVYFKYDEDGKPISIHTREATLFDTSPSAADCADARKDTAAPQQHFILCGSIRDVVIFGELGFLSSELTSLENFTGQDIKRFFAADIHHDADLRYQFVLADFNLSDLRLERMLGIENVVERLNMAGLLYKFNPGRRFRYWRPNVEDLRLIESAASFADKEALRGAIEASLQTSASRAWPKQLDNKTTHAEANARLRKAMRSNPPNPVELREALDTVSDLDEQSIFARIERMRDETEDPLKLITIDELVIRLRNQFESRPDIVRAKQILANRSPAQNEQPSLEWSKRAHANYNAVRDLFKQLRR